MCKECGCGETGTTHTHDGHTHTHAHGGHDHHHETDARGSRTLAIEKKILSRNDEFASANRTWFADRGIVAINIISSPGAGKTLLLERTLERLQNKVGCAVIVGDVQTDNDARRLQGKGAEIRQIETHGACHLDAERVGKLLPEVVKKDTRLVFIENVGNLVCPAAFDLGENFKIALLSTTEGEDKPSKYPAIFSAAPVVVLTKMDLASHLDWSLESCRNHLRRTHPGVFIFELSAKTGAGMDPWIDYLSKLAG